MLYKNTKTGAIIDVTSEIGGNWAPVSDEPVENEAKEEKKTSKTKTAKK